jgi:hypothetical protein
VLVYGDCGIVVETVAADEGISPMRQAEMAEKPTLRKDTQISVIVGYLGFMLNPTILESCAS